ncbi:MAG TPA: endolytic transglycosylase MltG, partial [Alphaproteobacteria bacterium]|nr:endolytic transglycosylase MltG [Alphaproteobacteria bacterium]
MRLLAFILLLAAAAAGGAFLWFQNAVVSPGPSTESTRVLVERGSGLARVSQQLEAAGVIKHARMFQALATWQGKETALKAGEYLLPAGESMVAILDRLVAGDVIVHRLTFPEGITTHAILAQIRATEGLTGNVPEELPEGSLMPASYDFVWGDSRAAILNRMQKSMQDAVAEAWEARAEDIPLQTPEDLVILASIIEKETGLEGERGEVAGVFVNRLRKGMKLQSDPTTIYAVTRGKKTLGRG